MQIIGFNFTKISGTKSLDFKPGTINTHIEFINVEKEKLDLFKEEEALKLSFRFIILYGEIRKDEIEQPNINESDADITFEGTLILSLPKEESKEIQKAWKKKNLPQTFQAPLYNFILRKCTPKAVFLEDEIGLPTHLKVPQISFSKEENSS